MKEMNSGQGKPEGLPVAVYFWKSDEGQTFLQMTTHTEHKSGKPRKSGMLINLGKAASPLETRSLMGAALISILNWTCRESDPAGDIAFLKDLHYRDPVVLASDLTSSEEYQETGPNWEET